MARPSRKRKPVLPVILLLLALGAIGLWVGNFRLTGKVVGDGLKFTKDGATIHWEKGEAIPFTLHNAGSADISDGSDLAALRRSFKMFERVPGAAIQFEDMGATSVKRSGYNVDDPGDNENLVWWEEDDWGFDPNVLAVTLTVFYTDTGQMLDGDIVFNGVKYDWTTTGERGKHDVENTMAHELGHFMGLNHNGANSDATMYPAAQPGETLKRDLHRADVEYLQHLYGDGDAPPPPPGPPSGRQRDDRFAGGSPTPGDPNDPGAALAVGTVKGGCGGGSMSGLPASIWRQRR